MQQVDPVEVLEQMELQTPGEVVGLEHLELGLLDLADQEW